VYNRFINNYIHDNGIASTKPMTGICDFFFGRSIIYGNVIYRNTENAVRVTNNEVISGTKYIVNNIMAKPGGATSNQINVNADSAYTDGGTDERAANGLVFQYNIFYKGRKMYVGTDFQPSYDISFVQNYFAWETLQLYNYPTQIQLLNNYFAYSWLYFDAYAGYDPVRFPSKPPSVITGVSQLAVRVLADA
jgi:hypothetical protein